MVLDTSAIVAMHLQERGFERLLEKVDRASVVAVGAPTLFEAAMVLTARLSRDARPLLMSSLRSLDAQIVPFSETHFDVAVEAFLRFGRGHHRARLNFGDCMAYAVAVVADLPLLYTGKDFAQTDILAA